jgi:hypothetical protein
MAAAIALPWSRTRAMIFPIAAMTRTSAVAFLLAVLALVTLPSFCRAGEPAYSPSPALPAPALFGWFAAREPDDLPPRFRTNCGFHNGRFYCAYHCGTDYQFYYCSQISYGCCHFGDGYCDYRGFLRCRP